MSYLTKIIGTKIEEVNEMNAIDVVRTEPIRLLDLMRDGFHVIAEIKRASPSKGLIREEVDVAERARAYEAAGATMISVLTDATYFKGSFHDLKTVADAVEIPVLCKDFIIDERQLDRAKAAGASAALLIVAALHPSRLATLTTYARTIGLDVLVEVHDEAELEIALRLENVLIGINNRNLKTFEVTLDTSIELMQRYLDVTFVSESGVDRKEAAERLHAAGARAILVGEALMREEDPTSLIKELTACSLKYVE
ncbi:indole-3-glycerol phosphate synthase TrpC [Exiguobacterium alkaliphilum]|uniref:Indole-3-glycerol phosphate synthase n=1 Tax=Exiguobacterium alkaliphilum TaxID=1428684 RepID=A0ABT2KYR3_9BACL|nr:indole-3-glycerol phosphate synthase TrpC [Exiguobacterium alkaliphilum]MCT4794815.1 indole-3-glycerol phosphate synthase TrpC [Exiguobacterium alkaliphilum]